MATITLPNGAILSYQSKGAGQPLLCIHAPGIGSVNFSRQEPLSANCQLIVPDLRGHGDSSAFQEPFTHATIADDLHALLSLLNCQKTILCGYSQGASIALECLLRHPDSYAGAILISGFSEVSDLYLHTRFYLAQTLAFLHGVSMLAHSTASSHLDTEAERKLWITHAEKTDAYSLHQLYLAGHVYHRTDQLCEINKPILLLYGGADKPMHQYGHIMAERLPQAQLRFLPNEKHQLVTRAAETCNRLIVDFIETINARELQQV